MFIDQDGIHKSLVWHSSPVDWCEGNYKVVPFVVEFYNTFSNLIFLIYPPILMYLFRGYTKAVNAGIQLMWLSFMIVGITSAYFHGTLSLMGQLLDEISILWLYALGVTFFGPRHYTTLIAKSRSHFALLIFITTVALTILSVWRPYVNAFVQMFLVVIPLVSYMYVELQKVKNTDKDVYNLGIRSLIVGLTAVFIWFNDRMFCDFYTQFGMTYLHAVWHILSFVATYSATVAAAYFYAKADMKKVTCRLSYWPCDDMKTIGIPYVEILRKNKKVKF